MGTDNDRTIFKLGDIVLPILVVVGVVEVVFEFEFKPRRCSREGFISRDDMVNCDSSLLCVLCDPIV
jgi:hypothetical protein